MEETLLRAQERKGTGKGVSRKLRKEGSIPAVLYGKDVAPVPIKISAREWVVLMRHARRNVILNMELQGDKGIENRPVMVKEIQRGYLGDDIVHIDFLQVSMERAVEVEIPIRPLGAASSSEDAN